MMYGSFGFYRPREESFSNQIDRNGMQLYSKEYQEWEDNSPFHIHKTVSAGDQDIDYLTGIHFEDRP